MLETIRTAYLASVAALIATYPGQEANRATYEADAAALKLGRLRRRIRTKLHDFPQGTLVGFVPEDERRAAMRKAEGLGPMVSIWAPELSSGSTMTLVDVGEVEPVCSLCQGSGAVRHRDGLVSFACPSC
jgi:hypothetical protein